MKIRLLSPVLAMLFAVSGYAYDFSRADSLFESRENNLQAISQARSLYQQALKNASGKDDLIYAVDHLGKLAFYEGELLTPESNSSKRVEIFLQCQEDVKSIHPDKVGKTGAYYYWNAACLGLWVKSASSFSALWRLSEVKAAFGALLENATDYASGGGYRILGGVGAKSQARVFGLYDPAKALEYINKAIELGPQYYNVYIIKAEVLNVLGRSSEAKQLLLSTKQDLEAKAARGQLPQGLEAESKVFLKQLQDLTK